MRHPLAPRALAFSLLLLVAAAGASQTSVSGQTASGAYYSITVPDGWTPADGLAIWFPGSSLDPPSPNPDLGPLADLQLSEGYAVASTSYSQTGWALFQLRQDTQQLLAAFANQFGSPNQVMLTGASVGGLAAVQTAETGAVGNVVGALPICAPLAGSRNWDGALDLRLIYDAVCQAVPGAAIPGGITGLPIPPDPAFDQGALENAVNTCTGVLLAPADRTGEQQARLDLILGLSTIPESFLLTDMGQATFGLSDLVADPTKLAGAQAMHNLEVTYGDPTVDASIERASADPLARRRLLEHYTPDGALGATKVISLHTSQDGLVFPENQSDYAAVAPLSQVVVAIVAEDTPSHCGFSEGEVVASWESLRAWVAGLPQPTAQQLQDTCEALVAGNLAAGPCRIDPAIALAALDSRIPPRPVLAVPTVAIPVLGTLGLFALAFGLILAALPLVRLAR